MSKDTRYVIGDACAVRRKQVQTMKLTIIGGGNLATALVGGIVGAHRNSTLHVRVIDRNPEKRSLLTERYGVQTFATLAPELLQAELIVLAIKPDGIAAMSRELRAHLSPQVVVSVAAGIRTDTLSSWLGGYTRVVWAMPNTPSLVASGLTGLFATQDVTSEERALVQSVFESVGTTLWLHDENHMDALTAISGCGPAYVCMLVEALARAACTLGLSAETSALFALQTVQGAGKLLEHGSERPAQLRERVTTPRGITEQAVQSLRDSGLDAIIARAVARARLRSQSVGEQHAALQLQEQSVAKHSQDGA